jgi:hypothetical protein
MQLVVPARVRTLVWLAVFTLVLGVVAAPARAHGDGDGDGAAWARGFALDVVDHKIDSLEEYRNGAQTDQVWAIYTGGIEQLEGIKQQIAGEDDVDDIWDLKHQALSIYAETRELAEAADDQGDDHNEAHEAKDGKKDAEAKKKKEQEEQKRKDAEAKKKKEQEEQKRKDAEAKKKKEQEQAEAALARARAHTMELIDKKVRLMNAASLAAHHGPVSDIYRRAADAIEDLRPAADQAGSIAAFEGIDQQVWEIIHAAKKEIAAYRPGHDLDRDDKAGKHWRHADKHKHGHDDDGATGGEGTTGNTGDDQQNGGDTGGDTGTTDGTTDTDDQSAGGDTGTTDGTTDTGGDQSTGGDQQDNGMTEEEIILAALNSMELQVDMYQIEIELTMNPEVSLEGPEALDAGYAVLDAIDAARLLTGDELVLAFAEVNDLYNTYIHLVQIYDMVSNVGIFDGEVTPI